MNYFIKSLKIVAEGVSQSNNNMERKFTIYVEDYNVPLSPWYILNDDIFSKLSKLTHGELNFDSLFYFEKDLVLWGPVESQFTEAGNYYAKKIQEDKSFAQNIIDNHYNSFEEIENFINDLLKTDLNKKENKELYAIYNDAYNIFSRCWFWGMIIQFLDMGSVKFSEKVKESLADKLKILGEPNIVFSKLITPIKDTYLSKETKDVLKILSKIKNDSKLKSDFEKSNSFVGLSDNLKEQIEKLVNNYGWMQYYYSGPAADNNYYFDLLKRKYGGDAEVELIKKEQESKELEQFQNKTEDILNKEEVFLINILKEFSFLKEMRKELQMYYFNFAMHKWYSEVARRFYWSPTQTRYIIKDEFEKILKEGKNILNADDLNDRYNCCAFIFEDGKKKLVYGQAAKKYRNMFISNAVIEENINEIKGQVAFPGKKRGIVKIVNSINDIDKFNEGDILVSFSTNPSIVPAMNKAAAIITNTGGITCHAAIVARELKIPCIIGTKIATQALKDGDLVEVDADNGIVKILEK